MADLHNVLYGILQEGGAHRLAWSTVNAMVFPGKRLAGAEHRGEVLAMQMLWRRDRTAPCPYPGASGDSRGRFCGCDPLDVLQAARDVGGADTPTHLVYQRGLQDFGAAGPGPIMPMRPDRSRPAHWERPACRPAR
jgi:hypothetical protein